MFDLKGKKALVTGSTQGIGYAIAKAFVEAGAEVYVHCSRDLTKAQKIADEIGAFGAVVADLSEAGAANKLYAKTGALDILVTNASVQYRRPWDAIGDDEFATQVQVNLKSTLDLMQKYAEPMKAKGWGRIVTVGSVQQSRPHKDMAVYAATKCAVMSLVRNVGKQLAPYGVTVNNLSPGVIATPRNDAALSDEEYRARVLAAIPAGYAGEASDCAGAALLLCSDAGRYILGIDLVVDGGMQL